MEKGSPPSVGRTQGEAQWELIPLDALRPKFYKSSYHYISKAFDTILRLCVLWFSIGSVFSSAPFSDDAFHPRGVNLPESIAGYFGNYKE